MSKSLSYLNVAYAIHLRNQINYNQDPIVVSLMCYLYDNCHDVVQW